MTVRVGSYSIPASTKESIEAYVNTRRPTGGFLRAVLSNDLKEACARADEDNRRCLFEIVCVLYNYAPSKCWGSPEKVDAWLEGGVRRAPACLPTVDR